MSELGYAWLTKKFGLKYRPLLHKSFIGPRSVTKYPDGTVNEFYINQYDPGDSPLDHVVFALKYDGWDFNLLSEVLKHIPAQEVADFVAARPTGKYSKQIGYLFEKLTGNEVPLARAVVGNYVTILDPDQFVTTTPTKIPQWRIDDNMLGSSRFSPLIRRTEKIHRIERARWDERIDDTLNLFPKDLLTRALSFLYFKETRSSFAIEREEVGEQKMDRFVALLHRAGTSEHPLSPRHLTELQNAIVDPRYEEREFREIQNYIGETGINFREIVHSVGTPPPHLSSLMEGLGEFYEMSGDLHPVLRAAAISFPFVFIHPFIDGNGRIHRYLIHDILARGGIGRTNLLLPISATILSNMDLYDACLESFSKPLMAATDYTFQGEQNLVVQNPDEIVSFFRYPDLTRQCEFLGDMLEETIDRAIPEEIRFLESFDQARANIVAIVDMPERKRELILRRLHENKGRLGRKSRERDFSELTDNEITRIEEAFRAAFAKEFEENTD